MVGVGDQKCLLVEKHRLRLLERNPVLAPALRVLSLVLLEAKHGHPIAMYIQCRENSTPNRWGCCSSLTHVYDELDKTGPGQLKTKPLAASPPKPWGCRRASLGGNDLLAVHNQDSNSLRGTPDCRIMDCS